jgi:hypothetical protein
VLSFSLPYAIPRDKYRVEVFRYGSQIAPNLGEFGENDQYVRVTDDGRPLVLSYEEATAMERLEETEEDKEQRLQRETTGAKWEDPKKRGANLLFEKTAKEAKKAKEAREAASAKLRERKGAAVVVRKEKGGKSSAVATNKGHTRRGSWAMFSAMFIEGDSDEEEEEEQGGGDGSGESDSSESNSGSDSEEGE